MPLNNQTFLITGAGRGLGRIAALALAQHRAQVILLDNNIEKLESVYDHIIESTKTEPAIYPFDLVGATEQDFHDLTEAIEKKYNSLNGLIHSATEKPTLGPLGSISPQSWEHSINLNLNAPFLLTKVLLPLLEKNEHASILFTSDSTARKGTAYSSSYGVAKIAIEGFALIIADELESAGKIRVNILIPGKVDSPVRNHLFPGENKSSLANTESLTPIYQYLLGPESIGVTRQIIEAESFKSKNTI